MAVLGRDGNRRDRAAVPAPVEEYRRRGDVVVPQIVVNRLEVPDPCAGVGAKGHDRVGEQVVSEALAAEVVVARAARRNVNQVARLVGDDDRPRVGAARTSRGPALPRVRADGARILRHRVPAPQQLAGDRMERAHLAARMHLVGPVGNGGTDDDRVTHHGRRRGHGIVREAGRGNAQALAQVDRAALAEGWNRLASRRVERDQARVDGRHEDAPVSTAPPGRHAATRVVAPALVARDLRIEGPPLFAGDRIQGNDAAEGRTQEERVIEVQRRRLVRRRPAHFRAVGIARAEGPRDFERRDILAANVAQRREPFAAGIAPIGRPVSVLRRSDESRGDDERERRNQHAANRPGC